MSEGKNEHVPFTSPQEKIGESVDREIHAHEGVVTKEFKPGKERTFPTKEDALSTLRATSEVRTKLAEAMRAKGISESVYTHMTPVIHSSASGEVTYSEVQELIPEARNLRDEGFGIFTLPKTAREDLQKLFELNIETWKEEGYFLDVTGSSPKTSSKAGMVTRRLLPLFFSENIVIDQDKHIRFIDSGKVARSDVAKGVGNSMYYYSELVGSYLSAGILKAYNAVR